jgi:hypothetical protein
MGLIRRLLGFEPFVNFNKGTFTGVHRTFFWVFPTHINKLKRILQPIGHGLSLLCIRT